MAGDRVDTEGQIEELGGPTDGRVKESKFHVPGAQQAREKKVQDGIQGTQEDHVGPSSNLKEFQLRQ